MGAPDWDLVAQNKTTPIPKKDMVAADAQKVTLGDTTLTLYATPGHTAGTFSVVIPGEGQRPPASSRDLGWHSSGPDLLSGVD